MSCKEKFERNHVPSIVLVMSSTDMKPGVACAIYGRKELENECKYSLEVRTKKTTQKKTEQEITFSLLYFTKCSNIKTARKFALCT